MALVINSNVMSLNAQRNLTSSQNEQNQAMERLTSGKRINSAADDAAGLSIASRMTSQISGLNQAVRNANDGQSLIQTAEGALDESTNILQRMRELSIQSANGTYDSGNRSTMNAEVNQLVAELDRISETTSFNGQNVLDGTLGKVELQVGSESNQTIALEIGKLDSASLGGNAGDIVGEATSGLAALSAFTAGSAGLTLTINDQTISSLADADAGATLAEKLATINSDLDGFGAKASTLVEVKATTSGDGVLRAGTDKLDLTVTDQYGNASTYSVTGTESMDDLVQTINAETGGAISASVEDGKLVMTTENAVTLAVAQTGTGAGTLAASTNFSMVFTDTSAEGNGVKIESGDNTNAAAEAAIKNLGVDVQDDDGNLVASTATTAAAADVAEGDLIINGVEIGAIAEGAAAINSAANSIEAINKLSDQTGVVASMVSGDTDRIQLRSTTGGEISVEYGEKATAADIMGITGLQERNAASGSGSVSTINISTAEGAQKAIGIIDKALDQINSTRGDLGAVANRLDFTVSNLSNVAESVSEARSRIEDADFAQESANLSRAQVLQQAGTAMLAQANAAPQQVLSLLQ